MTIDHALALTAALTFKLLNGFTQAFFDADVITIGAIHNSGCNRDTTGFKIQ
jgi:hypothetical protein